MCTLSGRSPRRGAVGAGAGASGFRGPGAGAVKMRQLRNHGSNNEF